MPDIVKLSRNAKEYLISQDFTGTRRDGPWTWKKKHRLHVPQQNEMLSLYCTALGFISENEEYNPK